MTDLPNIDLPHVKVKAILHKLHSTLMECLKEQKISAELSIAVYPAILSELLVSYLMSVTGLPKHHAAHLRNRLADSMLESIEATLRESISDN